jgi:4-hydroxyphenylpyruvate dioxygenase
MHFIDQKSELSKVWDTEFTPIGAADTAGAGLTSVDHIAQTMNYEEMLSWVLFYVSIFRTQKSPMVDVVDPAGLVRSQVIENDNGSLRITLNGAESRRTVAGHFIAESFGSAVQHVAFATRNIFVTAEALAGRGFRPLVVSDNYYDDLGARFDLDTTFCDRLRASSVLYDRDDAGEYFQLFSPNYGDGFFFEIVERRKGYHGYGAANAPFRIAAQHRAMQPGFVSD